MRTRIAIPILLCIAMMLGSVSATWAYAGEQPLGARQVQAADAEVLMRRFEEAAHSLYTASYADNRQAGYKYVQQLERLLPQLETGIEGRPAGWSKLQQSIQAVSDELLSKRQPVEWMAPSARIHLTADAMLRPASGLWMQYERVMLEDVSRVRKAWKRPYEERADAARAAMDNLSAHLALVEGPASMLRPEGRTAELHERIRYTNVLLSAGPRDQAQAGRVDEALTQLGAAVSRLFTDKPQSVEEPALAPPASANPVSWTLLLGAFIMAVLAYKSWRKYKQQPYGIKPLP
ncbi:Sporulation protein YpjB (SpoYpjB) [Paenibacillus algorifonticola]|uniref:Sporulation protein YpjB (SpoYpjB) n=1 Tax=Paenibacillus algorifonticola TaxID=684063 RepID=A0A1I2EE22_9BACL|nr:sporulation protein YpjB [Paenibacillus algorifonticola]SFE90731.1 Sporulation protein YpjB (SpoYpjB) [Paenibacillus algorifonticola]